MKKKHRHKWIFINDCSHCDAWSTWCGVENCAEIRYWVNGKSTIEE